MITFFHQIVLNISHSLFSLGYVGIFLLMFLESSFFPFPSEVVMIPAGYLSSLGEMNLYLSIILGTLGSLFGAFLNYYLGYKLGRSFLEKYGKYLLIKEKTMKKIDEMFAKNGEVITFFGRLLPGVRQYISFPPGVAKMSFSKFALFTFLGAGLWVSILSFLGYFIGENEVLIQMYLHQITIILIFISLIFFLAYVFLKKKKL